MTTVTPDAATTSNGSHTPANVDPLAAEGGVGPTPASIVTVGQENSYPVGTFPGVRSHEPGPRRVAEMFTGAVRFDP